jgi:hypothetical protein
LNRSPDALYSPYRSTSFSTPAARFSIDHDRIRHFRCDDKCLAEMLPHLKKAFKLLQQAMEEE